MTEARAQSKTEPKLGMAFQYAAVRLRSAIVVYAHGIHPSHGWHTYLDRIGPPNPPEFNLYSDPPQKPMTPRESGEPMLYTVKATFRYLEGQISEVIVNDRRGANHVPVLSMSQTPALDGGDPPFPYFLLGGDPPFPPRGEQALTLSLLDRDLNEKHISVTGTLTDEGGKCHSLREDSSSDLYSIIGRLGEFKGGDHVTVSGTVDESSWCVQGVSIRMSSITLAAEEEDKVDQSKDTGISPQGKKVTVTGILTDEGIECQALREDGSGDLYTLTGDIEKFGVGDHVVVEGVLVDISICMQGKTIGVSSITAAP